MASWGLRFLLNCRPAAYRRSTEASIRLLAYSQRKLRETVSETDVAYDGLRNGILKIVADSKALDADEAEARSLSRQIGRAHVGTPDTNAHLVCRLLLEKTKHMSYPTHITTIIY